MKSHLIFLLLALGASVSSHAAMELGHSKCIACHKLDQPSLRSAELQLPLPDLCLDCHPDRAGNGEHAIGIPQSADAVGGLPLTDGKIGCNTCHDSHITKPGLLRFTQSELCLACHKL